LLERNRDDVSRAQLAGRRQLDIPLGGADTADLLERIDELTDERSRAPLEPASSRKGSPDAGFEPGSAHPEEKRALLAERLRNQSRLTTSAATLSRGEGSAPQESNEGRRSFLDGEVIALASLKDWRVEEQGPYTRHVAPYKGFLYQRLGMDKTFVRGRMLPVRCRRTGYADCIAQFGAPFRLATIRSRYGRRWKACDGRRCRTW